jgi:hypothetical protein
MTSASTNCCSRRGRCIHLPRHAPVWISPTFTVSYRKTDMSPCKLLWEEYRETQPGGYRYSRYVAAKIMLRGRKSPLLAGGPLALDAT